MTVKQTLLLIVFTCMLGGLVHAQESQQQQQQQTSTPLGSTSSSLALQGIISYLLGPGDVLDLRVFGQPELTSSVQVDSDGNLSALLFLETPIKAKCCSDKDVQKDIAAAYSKFI